MSLPFTKGRHQDGDEQGVNQENLIEPRPRRDDDRRWRGFEIGFKLRKVTRTVRTGPQPGRGQIALAKVEAGIAPGAAGAPDGGSEETSTSFEAMFCLTPPTDPPSGPPK